VIRPGVEWQPLVVVASQGVSVSMLLRDWLFIDGEMDLTGQAGMDDNDEVLATTAHAIREAGWNATGHITRPISDSGLWPPADGAMNERVSVSLTTADWRFVVERLLIGSEVAASVGHADDAARTR
jgi:hypothetical protein